MRARTGGLYGVGAVGALTGVATSVASGDSLEPSDVAARVTEGFHGAFATSPWSELPLVAGAAVALAAALTLADTLASRRTILTASKRPTQASPDVRTALKELRARLTSLGGERPDVIQLGDELLRGALEVGASDIHVAPTPEGLKLTYRIQGELADVATLPGGTHALLVTRLKVLARLDTYVRGTPQDGRLVTTMDGGSVEARVSTLPTELGERVVLRLVRGGRTVPELESLGFSPQVERSMLDLLTRPQGLLFVTGPVGSGKTTTLYAALQHIARSRSHTTAMVTLEDPIELELPFATQTQINPKTGMSFASTLRSVLRQDPNVLMVGEIRDRETAEIAMQSGLTGHLILTTVHGQSAAGVFARLVEMGVEPFVLASATLGCLSQRLARALCGACRKEVPPSDLVRERLVAAGIELPEGRYFEPGGCDACEGRGFLGRVPIAELLVVDDAMRSAVNAKTPTGELTALATSRGMVPVLADGVARARAGETSLLEVLRVAG